MEKHKSNILKLTLLVILLILLVVFCLSAMGSTLLSAVYPADSNLFLTLNGLHNTFFDPIMLAASSKLFWIPFYLFIVFLLYRSFGKKVWITLLIIGLMVASADQISSGLIKNHVQRLRPSHQPELSALIHLSKAGAGGMYGFVSSHATNALALCVFLILIMDPKHRWFKFTVCLWGLLVCYSRIYNGVHYPSDALVGALVGGLLGAIFYFIHEELKRRVGFGKG